MSKLTIEKIELLYKHAKKFHLKQIGLIEAKRSLEKHGIKNTSAQDYLYGYSKMVSGERYIRTLSTIGVRYYLRSIKAETPNLLPNALTAISLHISYYEEASGTTMRKLRSILSEYSIPLTEETYYTQPDEISTTDKLTEGSVKQVYVNIYERNVNARKRCITHHGCICSVCLFDFEKTFGEIGKGFIHVHHIKEISNIGKEYVVDPINDLIPVCPNCHAMLHKMKPAYTIQELKDEMSKF